MPKMQVAQCSCGSQHFVPKSIVQIVPITHPSNNTGQVQFIALPDIMVCADCQTVLFKIIGATSMSVAPLQPVKEDAEEKARLLADDMTLQIGGNGKKIIHKG